MVLINIKIFNKFENLVILLSEQKFGDFGGGGTIEELTSNSYETKMFLKYNETKEICKLIKL